MQLLTEWVARKEMGTLNPSLARSIVADFFCGTIMTRGVCPVDCQVCKREVVDLFRLNGARNAGALLTWTAKDHAAKWIEKLIERQKNGSTDPHIPVQESVSAPASERAAFQNLFPRRGPEENIFLELGKEYD